MFLAVIEIARQNEKPAEGLTPGRLIVKKGLLQPVIDHTSADPLFKRDFASITDFR